MIPFYYVHINYVGRGGGTKAAVHVYNMSWNGVCRVESDAKIVKADFCSFRYTFDQNTLLKTSQTIRKCAQECSSEQMGWRCIHQGHQDVGRNLPNLQYGGCWLEKKLMGFRCIHVMIISKHTFVEFLNEMESYLRILDCREMSTKVFKRRYNRSLENAYIHLDGD